MYSMSLRCDCGEHALDVPRALREQFFEDASLGAAPWPLVEGTQPAKPGEHEVPLAKVLPWFNRAQSGLNNKREALPELFTLLGRTGMGEVVTTAVLLESPRVGVARVAAAESPHIGAEWEDLPGAVGAAPLDGRAWSRRFGLPAPLPVPHIRCLDVNNTQVDPDWLQGVLWRTPFQLRRGDLLSFFEAEFTELHALMLHVARTGEALTVHVV